MEGEGTYPFSVAVLVLVVCFVDVGSVETYDHECEDHLAEAECRVHDIASRHLDSIHDTHLVADCAWLS